MPKLLPLALTLLFSLSMAPLPRSEGAWPIQKVMPAVKQLTYSVSGVCTAVAVGKKNVYLTASHCIEPGGDHFLDSALRVRVLHVDPTPGGLAVLKADVDLPSRPLEVGEAPHAGDLQLWVGYAEGAPFLSYLQGFLGADRVITGEEVLSFSSGVIPVPGMSGGPVVNKQGKLVGLVAGHAGSFGLSVSYGVVREAVEKWRNVN